MAGSMPPVNNAAMETPVTDPTVIKTRLGGMVSVCAPVVASKATRSPSLAPRWRISGNSTGATAAISATLEPEMPDTRYMAPISTNDRPPRTCPTRLAKKATMARAMPVISISSPKNTNSGTANKMRCDMPSSIRPTSTVNGNVVVKARKPKVARPKATPIGVPISTVTAVTPTKYSSKLAVPYPCSSGAAT